jgi:hypothetical protein
VRRTVQAVGRRRKGCGVHPGRLQREAPLPEAVRARKRSVRCRACAPRAAVRIKRRVAAHFASAALQAVTRVHVPGQRVAGGSGRTQRGVVQTVQECIVRRRGVGRAPKTLRLRGGEWRERRPALMCRRRRLVRAHAGLRSAARPAAPPHVWLRGARMRRGGTGRVGSGTCGNRVCASAGMRVPRRASADLEHLRGTAVARTLVPHAVAQHRAAGHDRRHLLQQHILACGWLRAQLLEGRDR